MSNWGGALVPWKLIHLPSGELGAPTADINTTIALALLVSLAYFYAGLSRKGLRYFEYYVEPTPIMLPFKIVEDFTKPLSLSFRLFGNILADELVVAVLAANRRVRHYRLHPSRRLLVGAEDGRRVADQG